MADDSLNNLNDQLTVVKTTIGEDYESSETRDSLGEKIRENLNDQGYFYKADDVNDSLQDAYDEIAAFTGCIEKAVEIPFEANRSYYDFYSLIPDYVAVVAVYNRRVKRWLSPVSIRELENIRDDWESAEGEPYAFWPVNYRYVAIFPQPSTTSGSLYVFYKAAAPTLAGNSEPAIPIEIAEDILTGYTTMDLYEQAEEWAKASRWFKGYTEKTAELIRFLKRRDAERPRRLGGI